MKMKILVVVNILKKEIILPQMIRLIKDLLAAKIYLLSSTTQASSPDLFSHPVGSDGCGGSSAKRMR